MVFKMIFLHVITRTKFDSAIRVLRYQINVLSCMSCFNFHTTSDIEFRAVCQMITVNKLRILKKKRLIFLNRRRSGKFNLERTVCIET